MLTFEHRGLDVPRLLSDYQEAWDYQRLVHAGVADGSRPGHVVLLEHSPVYTAGRRTKPSDYPVDGTPVVAVDRGGEITYHGPGQLVGYPIVHLADGLGVVDYVRTLESAIIDLLAGYGVDVRLSSPVRAIEASDTGARLFLDDGVLKADALVLAADPRAAREKRSLLISSAFSFSS